MGKKIIIMFSMMAAAITSLLIADLASSQMLYGELDNMAATVSYQISVNGGINPTIKMYVKKEIDANIYASDPEQSVKKGDIYFYIVEKEFTPIILQTKYIKVKRSVIIG